MADSVALDKLIEDLGSQDVLIRIEAKACLVAYGTRVTEPLITILEIGTIRQVDSAIMALGEIGDPSAIEPLIKILYSSYALLRIDAAKALSAFHSPRVIDVLLANLTDNDQLVQTWVIDSLGKLGDLRAFEPLVMLLRETTSSMIRYMVIKTLGLLGDPRAIDYILPFTQDENHHVTDYAHEALSKLGYTDIRHRNDSDFLGKG
ncbi:MAG: HEAT repeat domain-containing protein [Chloroflexota bacterium]